jgi:SpoVK/Ycf46/Vps4 family AAA+-type ATPase
MLRTSPGSSGPIRTQVDLVPEDDSKDVWREDRYGFLRWTVLPRPEWRPWWDRIYVPEEAKERLRAYLGFCLRHRGSFDRVALPVHGIALLHGPPGTGKSSLARGLAEVVAEDLAADASAEETIFAEVDPHALPSQMLGESQRNTMNLLQKSIPELAAKGRPLIVVIDEVNTLATNRTLATGGRDPVDVMRATEAALRGVDYLADQHDNVAVIATTNFVASLDDAMIDRLDVAIEIALPDEDSRRKILRDTISELPASSISEEDALDIAETLAGHSGRDIRKAVLEAVVTRPVPIEAPLTAEEMRRAIRERGEDRTPARP